MSKFNRTLQEETQHAATKALEFEKLACGLYLLFGGGLVSTFFGDQLWWIALPCALGFLALAVKATENSVKWWTEHAKLGNQGSHGAPALQHHILVMDYLAHPKVEAKVDAIVDYLGRRPLPQVLRGVRAGRKKAPARNRDRDLMKA